jgi:hypothetical protein
LDGFLPVSGNKPSMPANRPRDGFDGRQIVRAMASKAPRDLSPIAAARAT